MPGGLPRGGGGGGMGGFGIDRYIRRRRDYLDLKLVQRLLLEVQVTKCNEILLFLVIE